MRPELAHALVDAGLVDAATDGLAPVPDLDLHAGSFSTIEGRKKLVLHLVRERNPAIIKATKESAPSHACEVCGFDSLAVYGVDDCEVHHPTPLGELDAESETTLDDLAIVCANCHRILHLDSSLSTLSKLRGRLASQDGRQSSSAR